MNKKKFIIFLLVLTSIIFTTNKKSSANQDSITLNNNNLFSDKNLKKEANKAFLDKDFKRSESLFEKLIKKFPNEEDYKKKYILSLYNTEEYSKLLKAKKFLNNYYKNSIDIDIKKYISDIDNKLKKISNDKNKIFYNILEAIEYPEIVYKLDFSIDEKNHNDFNSFISKIDKFKNLEYLRVSID